MHFSGVYKPKPKTNVRFIRIKNGAANIEAFSINPKYFGTFLKKIPENALFSIFFVIFAG